MADNGDMFPNKLKITFERIVQSDPRGKILDVGTEVVSYAILWEQAREIALELELALGKEKRHVIVDSKKCSSSLAIVVACWLLKWSYTFVDMKQPIQRTEQIMYASNASVLILQRSTEGITFGEKIELNSLELLNLKMSVQESNFYPFGPDTCYIMFTSGSTGAPKGVPISDEQVLQFANWLIEEFEVTDQDVLTSVNPWYFDNSVFDIYVSLLSGASLVLVDIDDSGGSLNWIDSLIYKKPTVWFSVPSLLIFLQSVGAFKESKLGCLRLIIFGGEAYPKSHLLQLMEDQGPTTHYVSVYGPTETTCICSVTKVNEAELKSSASFVSLGEFPNFFKVSLIDSFKLANGEIAGELMLGGSNVTEGYVDEKDSSGKFAHITLSDGKAERYYLTGDLVSYNQELGRLCFIGRKDNQVKRFGVRIELEEIESRLEKEFQSLFLADFDSSRSPDLCLVYKAKTTLDRKEVEYLCNTILPSYMVPRVVFEVAELPVNANGKKDRKRARELIREFLEVKM